MSGGRTLPEGRPGQILAVGLTAVALALVWLVAIGPLLGWYQDRQGQLAAQRGELDHLVTLRAGLPALRQQVAALAAHAVGPQALLAGSSDAIAGANLQAALQGLADAAGISLDSAAALPGEQVGTVRRIELDVGVTAPWPALVALLSAIDTARPRMIVDNITIGAGSSSDPGEDAPLQADFTVAAFRAGVAP